MLGRFLLLDDLAELVNVTRGVVASQRVDEQRMEFSVIDVGAQHVHAVTRRKRQ